MYFERNGFSFSGIVAENTYISKFREAELVHQGDVLIVSPLGDGGVTPGAAHDSATGQAEDGRQRMSSAVAAARIRDGGQEGKEAGGGVGFHAMTPGGIRAGAGAPIDEYFSYPPRMKLSTALAEHRHYRLQSRDGPSRRESLPRAEFVGFSSVACDL